MLTPAQVSTLGYIVAAIAAIVLFYFIIKGAVRSGTRDIVDELKKRNRELVD